MTMSTPRVVTLASHALFGSAERPLSRALSSADLQAMPLLKIRRKPVTITQTAATNSAALITSTFRAALLTHALTCSGSAALPLSHPFFAPAIRKGGQSAARQSAGDSPPRGP